MDRYYSLDPLCVSNANEFRFGHLLHSTTHHKECISLYRKIKSAFIKNVFSSKLLHNINFANIECYIILNAYVKQAIRIPDRENAYKIISTFILSLE